MVGVIDLGKERSEREWSRQDFCDELHHLMADHDIPNGYFMGLENKRGSDGNILEGFNAVDISENVPAEVIARHLLRFMGNLPNGGEVMKLLLEAEVDIKEVCYAKDFFPNSLSNG